MQKKCYSDTTYDSVHIHTQVNIDPVYFTFSPENYAQSWTVILLSDSFWCDLSVDIINTGYALDNPQ